MIRDLIPFEGNQKLSALGIRIQGGVEYWDDRLTLSFRFQGNIRQVLWPKPSASPLRMDRLWERTCLEAFVGVAGQPGYWELNCSPSGDWNFYRFDGYRQGMRRDPEAIAPRMTCKGLSEFGIELDLTMIPELKGLASHRLQASLCAVIELKSGDMSYWAWNHKRSQADFHCRDSFIPLD